MLWASCADPYSDNSSILPHTPLNENRVPWIIKGANIQLEHGQRHLLQGNILKSVRLPYSWLSLRHCGKNKSSDFLPSQTGNM